MAKLTSVKNLFWVNHASEMARNSLKRKIFEWTNVPEKMNRLDSAILENWVRNRQKNAQISLKSSKIAVFRLLVNEYPIEINYINSDRKLIIRKNRE